MNNNITPHHYKSGDIYEAINIMSAYGFIKDFCKGNVLKYLLRAGEKNKDTELEDLKKAQWYLNKLIETTENNN